MPDYLLTLITNYGAPVFGILLLLGALGIPVGASMFVIAAGTFSQQGTLNWGLAALLGFLGAIVGDALSFGIGFYSRDWVDTRFGRSPTWRSAERIFDRSAGPAIYLTRFLVTALAIPTNLIAGRSGITFRRFMLYDSLGELTWIILYGGLGYIFGSQWTLVSDFIGKFNGLFAGIVILGASLWLWTRRVRRRENAEVLP